MNNNWWCENIRATNPCGEQPLPPYGSCLLGSVNLTTFVRDPFGPKARFDWDEYREVVRVFTRMLDNVVEINGLPLAQQRDEILSKRRHGMGFLGLGSTLDHAEDALRLRGIGGLHRGRLARDGVRRLGNRAGAGARRKARRRSCARTSTVTGEMLRKRPEMVEGRLQGRRFHPRPRAAREVFALHAARRHRARRTWWTQLAETGARFTHHSSIAPTGTISLSLANNASNGIEP